jgi:histidine triad (HIT) family protein
MGETIFHKIISKEIPAEIVYEDDLAVAFHDINPAAPLHILIVPKKTIPGLCDITEVDKNLLGHMLYIASKLSRKFNIAESGYRVVINSGADGGQTVFQLHMHLLGGRPFEWPPG